jgi:hypothetical protein
MTCDGKRAGDACDVDGGLGTCVPDCDAQCLVCVAATPMKPSEPVTASGGCGGGGLVLVLVLVLGLVLGR